MFKDIIEKFKLKYLNPEKEIENELNYEDKTRICYGILNISNDIPYFYNNVFQDLELFKSNDENTVFNKIDNTMTTFGSIFLKNILKNPIKDISILEKRQIIIKNIVNNPKYQEDIEQNLIILKKNEYNLLWLWKEMEKETKEYIDMVYFRSKILSHLNKNKLLLRIVNYYRIVFSPAFSIISPIICIILPFLIVRFFFKVPISFKFFYKSFTSGVIDLPFNNRGGIFKGLKYISTTLWVIFYLHGIYNCLYVSHNINKVINLIHGKLNSISEFIRISYALNEKYYKLVNSDLVEKKLIDLWDNTFMKSPTLLSDKGMILATFSEIQDNKDMMLDIINYIAKLDCYSAISKLYINNSKNENAKYCFPKYINKNRPKIDIDGNWHPFIDNDSVVTNSLKMKGNIIITGPNAGGKSTFIKSILYSVLFSQTICISCCNKLELTPFSILNSYLNIPDCKGKESLFEAEMRRSLEHIDILNKLPKDNFALIIMDEIFSSTNPKEGIAGAYSICTKLGKYKNNISLITTHYNYITSLGKNKSKFINYHMPITRNENNDIKYNYKLKKGISKQFIALELLEKKGFDKKIINDARKICKKLGNV